MSKVRTNAEFVEEVKEEVSLEYTFLEKYINAHTKILCRHNYCGHEWEVRPNNFLRGSRCPYCYQHQEELDKMFNKDVDYKNNKEKGISEECYSIDNKINLINKTPVKINNKDIIY